ncbi:MAG: hypothetical protein ABFS12_03705 [Bacteroidota bacterium]
MLLVDFIKIVNMGYHSDLDIDFREAEKNPFIADVLGISYEELLLLKYKFRTDTRNKIYHIEFDKDSPKEVLSKIDRLEDGFFARIEPYELNVDQYYQREYESFSGNDKHLEKFQLEIENLKSLSELEIESKNLSEVLNRQICIGVIGTMETFLSEVFINHTMNNPVYFQKFIESHPEFKKRKFELRDIFQERNKIEETAKRVMLDTIYHNLPTVSKMYNSTFSIKFPNISEVYEYVIMRHDLVHRNGMTKEGQIVETNKTAIKDLIDCISQFVSEIAQELKLK